MVDFLLVMWNHRCPQRVWSDSGRESWWHGRWRVKKIKAKASACSPKYLRLSTFWPVDARNQRDVEICRVWLREGKGRSWKTSDLTAHVHQGAAFHFLQSAYTQVLRECLSRFVWTVLEISFWKFRFLKHDVLWNSLSIMIRILEHFLVRMILTYMQKNYRVSIHLFFSRAGKTGEPEATCSSLYYTLLHTIVWNQKDPNALTWKPQIAWYCKWHDIRVACWGGCRSLLYCSLPPGVAELLSLASTNITASPPAADPRPPQPSPRPVSHHLTKTAKYCRRNSGCWYLLPRLLCYI